MKPGALMFLASAALLFGLLPSAYGAPLPAPGTFLKSATAVAESDAKTKCVVDPKLDIISPDLPCSVTKFSTLGTSGERTYYAAWNHRPKKGARSKDERTEQLVLFYRGTNAPGLIPFWSDVVEFFGASEAVTQAVLHPTSSGLYLELIYSSGGTGGTWSEFFLNNGDSWRYLQQAYGKEAEKCLPKEYGLQSIQVDLDRMRAEAYAPTADDPNCCPSGKVILDLQVQGESLKGMNCKFMKVRR
ncbi:MAG: hypothetical protein U0136_11305 [Bdellovibrionota bacterium]